MTQRVVIAGFGDTGLLVAIHLGPGYEIVGISPKPCLVSGQELGIRLTQPETWKQDYRMSFERYRKLDRVRTVHGSITRIEPDQKRVFVNRADGSEGIEEYDALVISSGVTNGFWRNDALESLEEIDGNITEAATKIAGAKRIAVIGGGATGVGVAANLAERSPDKSVHFFYSDALPLPGYHPKVRKQLKSHLARVGVQLHPDHRARIPAGFRFDRLTEEPVSWSTGQASFQADLTLWAVGGTRPNNSFVPASMLDTEGFVRVDDHLRVTGQESIFAVGDIAASDPHRSSARNWGYRVVAHNLRAYLEGRGAKMQRYEAPQYRWGSILGVQRQGLRVFQPDGSSFRFPRWIVSSLLFPIAVRRVIYKGIRRAMRQDTAS